MPATDIERLRSIRTLPSLIKYLRDELDWPIDSDDTEALYFDYEPEELGLDSKTAVKIKEIKQLRPLDSKQPWGIFWVNFEKKRLPMVVLRRVLGNLVVKKRKSANKTDRPNWHLNDLLFISSYGEEEHRTISFAHFAEDLETDELPVLRVLGWDDQNSIMYLDRVANRLHTQIRWPDDPGALDAWRKRWSEAFTDRYREAIRSADVLIPELARLARAIRKRVRDTLDAENERGPMRKLLAAVRGLLIHDMDEDAFADMYAQTVAYGLLSARFSRPAGLTAQNLVQLTSVSNPFLENLLENLFRLNRGKFHFDVDEVGINDVLDLLRKTNIEAIKAAFNDQNPAEDPVIRFYEGFLKEYDPKQRIRRGIFFTPRPVVSYIVRSVHELLQAEFGLEEGLASKVTWGEMIKKFPNMKLPESVQPGDPFVCILDPATGTGTFLFTCIEVIERTMKDKWCRELGKKSWNDPEILARWREYVPKHLLPRLYGYELMMAPYAIAHLKLALKLGETGYQFRHGDRLRIYLTNSLEPPSEVADPKLADLFATLAKEAQEVNDIKRQKRFTVVIANPPYSVNSANKNSPMDVNLAVYKEGLDDERNLKPLNDDYAKFLRCSQLMVSHAGVGLLGMITNHSYATARLFRSMRRSLLQDFQQVHFLDLRGETNRDPSMAEDQNVFDIQQGVGIGVYVRSSAPSGLISKVRSHELTGSREIKYLWLANHAAFNVPWTIISPRPELYSFGFVSEDIEDEYRPFLPLNQLFGMGNVGYQTHRDDFVIDMDRNDLVARIELFKGSRGDESHLSDRFGVQSNRDWSVVSAHRALRKEADIDHLVRHTLYRPFDIRYIFDAAYMIDYDRRDLMQHMHGDNIGLLVSKVYDEHVFTSAFVTNWIVESKVADRTRGSYLFPLRLAGASGQLVLGTQRGRKWTSNLRQEQVAQIGERLGVKIRLLESDNDGNTISDIDILNYIYAVLYSPGYRSRYAEFLKIDFPRLPLTSSLELFRALARLGGELVALHLLESPKLEKPITRFVGNARLEIEKVSYARETVWLDKAQTTGFKGVPEYVWNFHIGGYQVCEKWLKDRKGRTLSKDDIAHYHKIVVALSETVRLMKEIDEVIDKHGGWPGAFTTSSEAKSQVEINMPLAAEASASYGKGESED